MDSQKVQQFVEKNSRVITDANRLARCVDGRYENITDMPLIAKPGADAGDVMTAFGALNIMGAELDNQQVLDAVIEVAGGANNFKFHSDSHTDAATPGLGCGHLKQAKLDADAYGLKQEQIDFLFTQLPGLLEQGAGQEILQGDHAETAVIVVDSETHGVEPLLRDGEEVQEAFIYQKTLHAQQLLRLARVLQEKIAATGVVKEESEIQTALNDSFGKQLTETLKRLANGLPVYTVYINDDGTVTVNE